MNAVADLLEMATTRERRERIKWYHARAVFFNCQRSVKESIELAGHCDHDEARMFLSAFRDGVPASREEARILLSNSADIRCRCLALWCNATNCEEVLRKAAEEGYALAQAKFPGTVEEKRGWSEKAAAQGEPEAMHVVARELWEGDNRVGMERSSQVGAARRFYLEAALLGHSPSQFAIGLQFCEKRSLERCQWYRRATLHGEKSMLPVLIKEATSQLNRYDKGSTGRCLFEIGRAIAGIVNWRVMVTNPNVCERAVNMYESWCAEARTGVMCWLWLARKLGVSKDIRLVIADLIWNERAEWSDNANPVV